MKLCDIARIIGETPGSVRSLYDLELLRINHGGADPLAGIVESGSDEEE